MIYCGACGAQNEEDRELCARCGVPLSLPSEAPEEEFLGPYHDAGDPERRRVSVAIGAVVGVLLVFFGALWLVSDAGGEPGDRTGDPAFGPLAPTTSSPVGARTPDASPQAIPGGTRTPSFPAVVTSPGPTAVASPTPDLVVAPTGRIAFSSNRPVPGRENRTYRDIYSIRSDGTGLLRLTAEPADDAEPSWAPTGESIAFTSDRSGLRQIHVMNADGSRPRRLTDDPNGAQTPDWSPDGLHIAYDGGPTPRSDIWLVPAMGGEGIQLTDNPVRETAPAWSPDGKQIVFMGLVGDYWQVFTMSSDGSDLRQITTDPVDHRFPRWMPDGRRILYNTRIPGDPPRVGQIYVMNEDGTNVRQITEEGEGANGRPFPSPDGRYIAFNSNRLDDNYEIYIMRPDGSEVQRLTNTLGDDFQPAWSP